MADTPVIGMTLMGANQSQKHVTFNNALLDLDILVQLTIQDRNLSSPPGSPADGDRYIVGSSGTGLWSGKDDNIAAYINGSWKFFAPLEGWTAWVLDESTLLQWDGTAWSEFTLGSSGSASTFGVNTTADTSNRLSVKADGVLFSHDDVTPGTGDIALTFNKAADTNDAVMYFQTAFDTRAILGLSGNDDFVIKVTPDGDTFYQALVIDKDTGNVAIGTSSDANNRLTVSGESMLFTNAGDLRFTFSKGAIGDDCALTFQTNFEGRALFGLLADDNFKITVSDDGSSYTEALIVNNSTGAVDLKQHPKFSGYCNYDQYNAADEWFTLDINNSEHNDQGDLSSGIFTAPHDGYYAFGTGCRLLSDGTPPVVMYIGLSIDNADPLPRHQTRTSEGTAGLDTNTCLFVSVCLKLTAGQTVRAKAFFSTGDSSLDADFSFFWGYQIA